MALKDIETWFQERPKWLQDAAYRLIQNGILTENDYSELLAICVAQASGQTIPYSGLPTDALSGTDSTKAVRLESISDVQGINALSPTKPLTFGKTSLAIVYGRNGAGKSGYVRLLKHACGARRPGELRGNIFVAGTQPKTAKFTISEGDQTKTYPWTGKSLSELHGVEIYDTACGLIYVNEENEVAFEPWLLRLFTLLTNACSTLSQRIQEQIEGHVSKKLDFPIEYVSTSAAAWYADLSVNTTTQEIDNNTAWKPKHETELNDINKRLAETNPVAKAVMLRRQKTVLMQLVSDLKKHCKRLLTENCSTYLGAKSDALTKRKAANEDAQKVFEKAPLVGVGTESWRLLWEQARRYSEEYAYKVLPFPNIEVEARCVLCQRNLDQESRDRFNSFEKFVKGELQRLASEAEQNLQKSAVTFVEVPTANTLTVQMEAAGIGDEPTKSMVIDFASQLAKRRQSCFAAESIAEISTLPPNTILIQLVQIARRLVKQARSYDNDAQGQNRPLLEQKVKELSARKWLNQQRKVIDDEVVRLQAIQRLQEADKLTNTMALSKRKSILAEELITKAYIERFQEELKQLKASRLAVELKKTRADVGRVYHRISLRNANEDIKTSDILSEGEFRIVSLAAFLADTEGRGTKNPFVFDDPISSLDQVYEEATAQRLVEMSKSRQVIVFTHRLSLVGSLEKYAEELGVEENIICLSWYVVGDITDLPINLKKTDKAANALANERLAAAKKAFNEGDAVYEKEAKSLCRDIRVLTERIVEVDLLAGVVKRFSPEVNTKGKIHHLAKITPEDCNFIDDLMTKYSRYEHSQSEEAPVELPKPDEIEKDLKNIVGFIEKVKKRQKM